MSQTITLTYHLSTQIRKVENSGSPGTQRGDLTMAPVSTPWIDLPMFRPLPGDAGAHFLRPSAAPRAIKGIALAVGGQTLKAGSTDAVEARPIAARCQGSGSGKVTEKDEFWGGISGNLGKTGENCWKHPEEIEETRLKTIVSKQFDPSFTKCGEKWWTFCKYGTVAGK